MQKIAELLFLLTNYLSAGPIKETEPQPEYTKYVKEITNEFVREMESKYPLNCSATGGSMPTDVNWIRVAFIACKKSTIEEARKMEVDGIELFLKKINSHEKIRPFLSVYPFTADRVHLSISFRPNGIDRSLDGSVASVCMGKGKIHYDRAENVKEWTGGSIDGPKSTPEKTVYLSPPGYTTMDRLFPLHSEPYEEALKIVQQDAQKKTQK